MRIIALACLGIFSISSFAQSDLDRKTVSFKVYNELSYYRTYRYVNLSSSLFGVESVEVSETRFLHPTFAIQWNGVGKNAHEIELSSFSLLQTNESERIDTVTGTTLSKTLRSDISFRYEWTFSARRSANEKWLLAATLGAQPYFWSQEESYALTNVFPSTQIRVGTRINLGARLNYAINDHLYLDINLPVPVFDVHNTSFKQENPDLPEEQRSTSTFELDMFPSYLAFRFGVGYRI